MLVSRLPVVVFVVLALATMHNPPCLDDHGTLAEHHMDGSSCEATALGLIGVGAAIVLSPLPRPEADDPSASVAEDDRPSWDRSLLGIWQL